MRLSPDQPRDSLLTTPSTEAEPQPRDGDPQPGKTWRWAVIHFPCLESVSPQGHIVMVSDKRHIAEARRKFPDLVLWHERELGMFGELMDQAGLDIQTFVAVNRLKLKTRGWFMGVEDRKPTVSGHTEAG